MGVAVDNKVRLVDGDLQVVPSAPADYAAFYSWSGTQLVPMGQVPVPTSFQGPPSAIAISHPLGLALVSCSSRLDAVNPVLAVQSASERSLSLFRVQRGRLAPMSRPILLKGAPVSIGVSGR